MVVEVRLQKPRWSGEEGPGSGRDLVSRFEAGRSVWGRGEELAAGGAASELQGASKVPELLVAAFSSSLQWWWKWKGKIAW